MCIKLSYSTVSYFEVNKVRFMYFPKILCSGSKRVYITYQSSILNITYVYTLKDLSVIIVFLILVDVNECYNNNGGCSHLCHNTFASYYCSCSNYEELDEDNHTCIGIISSLKFIHDVVVRNNYSYTISILQIVVDAVIIIH